MGYEGLSIDIQLSRLFLVPLVKITWEKKAPTCANIDNIEDKLRTHYGKLYTDEALYKAEIVEWEN